MQTFRKTLPIIAGLCFFIILNLILNFVFIPYQFTGMKIHRIETEDFQDLILGSSHGCAALDPDVMEEITGRKTFNAAAGGQYPRENYFLLCDALRAHKPERVIYEYDPAYWIADERFNRVARYQLDMMEASSVKASYFSDLCLNGDFRYVLMPWFTFRDSLGRFRENISVKTSEAYRTFSAQPFSNSYQTCLQNGFTAISDDAKRKDTIPELAFSEETDPIVEKNDRYFIRLVSFCREQGIELVVITTPVPPSTLEARKDFYEQAHVLMADLAGEFDFSFMDYTGSDNGSDRPSMSSTSDLSCIQAWPDEAYSDGEGHMYADTARQFSAVFAQDLSGTGTQA